MTKKSKLQNFPAVHFLAILLVVFFAFTFAYLDYNFVLFDTIPFREAKPPMLANLYTYDLFAFLPALAIFAFSPLIYQFLWKGRSSISLRRPFAFGVASFMLSLVLKDAAWYLFRAIAPVASDPLAYQWIRPSDYTATILGYAEILGFRIPLWYIALSPLIIAIFTSLIISPPQNLKETTWNQTTMADT